KGCWRCRTPGEYRRAILFHPDSVYLVRNFDNVWGRRASDLCSANSCAFGPKDCPESLRDGGKRALSVRSTHSSAHRSWSSRLLRSFAGAGVCHALPPVVMSVLGGTS